MKTIETKNKLIKELNAFIETNRKICWESEYEQGEFCIGEEKVRAFINELINQ